MTDVPELWWNVEHGVIMRVGVVDGIDYGWTVLGVADRWLDELPADAVQLVPAEPVDEKGRGPSYQRGRADGRMEQRAAETLRLSDQVARIAEWCRGIARKAEAQGNEALAATAPRIAEELDRALAGQVLEYARDPDPAALEVLAWLRDRGVVEVAMSDQPPFAPELADAPLVTGESGAPAPLVVDHPVHESTLPAELTRSVEFTCASCGGFVVTQPDYDGRLTCTGCRAVQPSSPTSGGPGA